MVFVLRRRGEQLEHSGHTREGWQQRITALVEHPRREHVIVGGHVLARFGGADHRDTERARRAGELEQRVSVQPSS
jgi:hypothetical protein